LICATGSELAKSEAVPEVKLVFLGGSRQATEEGGRSMKISKVAPIQVDHMIYKVG